MNGEIRPAARAGRRPSGALGLTRRQWLAVAGFTLLEMIVVISIIGILTAIALPNYKISILQAKESVLSEDLFRMRDLIDQYYADKGRYPASLQALVEDGYLRALPEDPITGAADWQAVEAEPEGDSNESPGIYDVHSASPLTSMTGTPYSEW